VGSLDGTTVVRWVGNLRFAFLKSGWNDTRTYN